MNTFFIVVVVLLAAMLAADAGAAFRQGQFVPPEPTASQTAACTEDAFRLCGEFMPDREMVKACMVKKRHLLSPTCKESIR
jgi:hypothetical protein